MLNKNRTGLIIGIFFGIIHMLWTVFVAVIPNELQTFLNWIFQIHSLEPIWILTPFDPVDAFLLIAMTTISGYVFGVCFAALWNLMHRLMPGNYSFLERKRNR